ncbi:MAG: hypothetical protein HQ559_08440, partial [Lentisphaerae bacterium]|nr:hypothetical protein [Lentisphaerota bacterium]
YLASDGRVLIADTGNDRIQTFLPSADLLAFHGVFEGVRTAISVDPQSWAGLTAQQDWFNVRITHVLADGRPMLLDVALVETAADSNLFQGVIAVDGGGDGQVSLPENIHIAVDPTAAVADSIQYYYEERTPEQDDPVLTEEATEPASLAFHGTVDGLPTTVTISNFAGLTAGVDTLTAEICQSYLAYGTQRVVEFTETGAETGTFRAQMAIEYGGEPQTRWVASVHNSAGSGNGWDNPVYVRVKGFPDPQTRQLLVGGVTFDLEEGDDGWWYLKGGSKCNVRFVWSHTKQKWQMSYWDTQNGEATPKDITVDEMKAEVKDLAGLERKVNICTAKIGFTQHMRTDPDTQTRFLFPSYYDCTDDGGSSWRDFISYDLSLQNVRRDLIKYARLRVRDITGKGAAGGVVFEYDMTEIVMDNEGDQGECFTGLTSFYTNEAGEVCMTVDADGEKNYFANVLTSKFIDPGPERRRMYEAELVVEYRGTQIIDIPGGGQGVGGVWQTIRVIRRFEARARHVAVSDDRGPVPVSTWREKHGLARMSSGGEPSGNHAFLHWGDIGGDQRRGSLREAMRCITPRGHLLSVGHGSFHIPAGVAGRAQGAATDAAVDTYGLIHLNNDDAPGGGLPRGFYAGFPRSGEDGGTVIPGSQPAYDLGDDLRVHRIHVTLKHCFTAMRSGFDPLSGKGNDSGPSVAGTLHALLNTGCCSADVVGGWGVHSMKGFADRFERDSRGLTVVNSDEGAGQGPTGLGLPERDNDADSSSTTEVSNPNGAAPGPGDCPTAPDPDTSKENTILIPHREIERFVQ